MLLTLKLGLLDVDEIIMSSGVIISEPIISSPKVLLIIFCWSLIIFSVSIICNKINLN